MARPRGRPRKDSPIPRITTEKELKEEAKALLEAMRDLDEAEIGERRPGKIVKGRKIAHTRADIDNIYPKVTFIPEENIPVTIQGVTYWLFADQEVTVPSEVKNIYDRHRAAMRRYGRNSIGVGGLEPEF